MGDRDNVALLPFAAGVVVGAVLTALGFKYMSSRPHPVTQTQQVGAMAKCTCKKDGRDDLLPKYIFRSLYKVLRYDLIITNKTKPNSANLVLLFEEFQRQIPKYTFRSLHKVYSYVLDLMDADEEERKRKARPHEANESQHSESDVRDVTASRERVTASRERITAPRERTTPSRERVTASRERATASHKRTPASRERTTASRECTPASRERATVSRERTTASRESVTFSPADTPCGFFTCGLGSLISGSSGASGWLPIAGSAFLLAMLAFLYKRIDKIRSLLGTQQDIDASSIDKEDCSRDYYASITKGKRNF